MWWNCTKLKKKKKKISQRKGSHMGLEQHDDTVYLFIHSFTYVYNILLFLL